MHHLCFACCATVKGQLHPDIASPEKAHLELGLDRRVFYSRALCELTTYSACATTSYVLVSLQRLHSLYIGIQAMYSDRTGFPQITSGTPSGHTNSQGFAGIFPVSAWKSTLTGPTLVALLCPCSEFHRCIELPGLSVNFDTCLP